MSHKPTQRRAPRATAASDNYSRKAAASSSTPQFDLRNPNTLAAAEDADEEYDAETAAILNLDEIGASSRGVKRNAVNLDGYDSDSSNEGFGGGKVDEDINAFDVVGAGGGKKKKKDEDDDNEDDMFGSGDSDDGDGGKVKKKAAGGKKGVRFLELDEIEGQELQGAGAGNDGRFDDKNESSSDEDEEDDDVPDEEVGAGGKKKHAPKLDGFHMKNEMQEGRFDTAGNFVRKAADADAIHDTWMEGVTKKEMKKAKESHDKREQEARARMMEDDALITGDVIASLIRMLERGETALEALARLGSQRTKPKKKLTWQERRKQKAGAMESESTNVEDEAKKEAEEAAEAKRKEQIDEITAAADRLLSRGFAEIYDEPREALTRMYKRETGEEWVDVAAGNDESEGDQAGEQAGAVDDSWEYRWTDGRDGEDKVYGPYGSAEMRAWRDAGFFGKGVEFRRKGETAAGWSRIGEF